MLEINSMARINKTDKSDVSMQLEQKIELMVQAANEKKAGNVVVLDFRDVEGIFTDAFLICSGSSERQVEAISDHIHTVMKQKGILPNHIEGAALNQWVLMDYGEIVVHVFFEHIRDYYRLENLWSQAKRVYPAE